MSETKQVHEWIKNEYNEYMSVDGVLLSYNPNVNANPLNRLYNAVGASLGIGTKAEETALKIEGKWYILNGDYRKEYAAVFPDKTKLLEIYKSHVGERSDWSTDDSDDEDVN